MKYSKEKVEEILYNIQYQINNYYIKSHKLPDSSTVDLTKGQIIL